MTSSLSLGLGFAWLFIPGLPSSVSMAYLHMSVEEAVSHCSSSYRTCTKPFITIALPIIPVKSARALDVVAMYVHVSVT